MSNGMENSIPIPTKEEKMVVLPGSGGDKEPIKYQELANV